MSERPNETVPFWRRPNAPFLMGVGVLVLAFIAGGMALGAALLADPDPGPGLGQASSPTGTSPSPTLDAEPSATSTLAATATPAESTPSRPSGPLNELATGGWATVAVNELNVRREPGLDAVAVSRLVQGAVMHLFQGPVDGDEGYAWYRVVSLGGTRGWVASGTVAEPFATMLTSDPDLVRCGTIESGVLTVAGSTITPKDPIRIGDLAVPASAFDDEQLGAFELLRATGEEACFSASMASDGAPRVRTQINYYACGRPDLDDDLIRLRPAPGMDAVVEYQVKDVAIIHPAVLDRAGPDDPMSANFRAVLRWMGLGGAAGCLNHGVQGGPDDVIGGLQIDAKQCTVIESVTSDRVVLRPASSTESVTLVMPVSVDPTLPIGQPTGVIIFALDGTNQRSVGVGPNAMVSCP